MPFYKTLNFPFECEVIIWKITESDEDLKNDLELSAKDKFIYNSMRSSDHRKGFLSSRKIIKEMGILSDDIYKDINGKPHLKNGKFLSITHSKEFSAVALSKKKVGLDIEIQQQKIKNLTSKFIINHTQIDNYDIKNLTNIWCIKESTYKAFGKKGLSLKDIKINHQNSKPYFSNFTFMQNEFIFENWVYNWKNYSLALAIESNFHGN